MAFFLCQRPDCGIEFKRRSDCKVKWKLLYCDEECRDWDRERVNREKDRLRQQKYRERKK